MLQVLRSALSWLHVRVERARPRAAAQGDGVDSVLQLERLIGELHLTALQAAAVTSGINALSAGVALKDPLALREVAPQPPGADKLVLPRRCREEIGVASKTMRPVRDFFADLKPARWDLEAFCADAEQFGTGEAAFLDLAGVVVTWRALSLRALSAVATLEPDVRRCLPASYASNTRLLKTMLRAVIKGGHPCVDGEGNLKLPDLPQRRPTMRPNVHLPCVIEHHGRTSQAIVKDISTGGAGLHGAPGLVPQTVILIEFEGGPCLAGLVVWSKGARAGVKFDVPLRPHHPLLAVDAHEQHAAPAHHA